MIKIAIATVPKYKFAPTKVSDVPSFSPKMATLLGQTLEHESYTLCPKAAKRSVKITSGAERSPCANKLPAKPIAAIKVGKPAIITITPAVDREKLCNPDRIVL